MTTHKHYAVSEVSGEHVGVLRIPTNDGKVLEKDIRSAIEKCLEEHFDTEVEVPEGLPESLFKMYGDDPEEITVKLPTLGTEERVSVAHSWLYTP